MSRLVSVCGGKSNLRLVGGSRRRSPLNRGTFGFSLVEMALSLGIMVFAMFSIIGLLGIGLNHNHTSVEETRATDILTILKSDCLNSRSLTASPLGVLGLPLPYSLSLSGAAQGSSAALVTTTPGYQVYTTGFNSALSANTLYTTGITDKEMPVAMASGVPFQASVVYVVIPAAPSRGPIEARLIVNWPCHPTASVSDLTNPGMVKGFVETYVTLPAP